MTVMVVTADAAWAEQLRGVADVEIPADLKAATALLLQEDTDFVVLDLTHPNLDALAILRLVRGTRWDAEILATGQRDLGDESIAAISKEAVLARLA